MVMELVRPKSLARNKAKQLFDEYLETGSSHELGKYVQVVFDMYPKIKLREEENLDKNNKTKTSIKSTSSSS
jgi:hypothetical protein